ncbi:hypothetical protein [Echinimonas agarilytica]|uniref:Uncharacterized protein n=1 Tax=Echinimonas agarilytica TaxID=1215918 RepID=A0AA41W877_9GAMM|nr:hypothetical protein [Echinimonas agarilytica]MCM2681042.1 hypothetical protein [Echinimonas agarilytica]
MLEQRDVVEEQPQATTLGNMLNMIAEHDQGAMPSKSDLATTDENQQVAVA